MKIDYNLLPKIAETMWKCENCDNAIDISWIIEDIINECSKNEIYREALYTDNTFEHGECDCCHNTIWFYEDQTEELKNFVKGNINENYKMV